MRSWICARFFVSPPSGMRICFVKKYLTKDTCKKRGVETPHANGTGRRDRIPDTRFASGAKLIVLGDTAFDADSIRGACEKHKATWITGQPERVLAGGKPPRPKVRSLLEKFKPQQFVAMRLHPGQGKLVPYRQLVPRTGSGRKQKSARSTCMGNAASTLGWRRCCSSVSTTEKPQRGKSLPEPKLMMSNDTSLTPQRLVELYAPALADRLFFKGLNPHAPVCIGTVSKTSAKSSTGLDWCSSRFCTWSGTGIRQLARSDLADQQRRWLESQRNARPLPRRSPFQ